MKTCTWAGSELVAILGPKNPHETHDRSPWSHIQLKVENDVRVQDVGEPGIPSVCYSYRHWLHAVTAGVREWYRRHILSSLEACCRRKVVASEQAEEGEMGGEAHVVGGSVLGRLAGGDS